MDLHSTLVVSPYIFLILLVCGSLAAGWLSFCWGAADAVPLFKKNKLLNCGVGSRIFNILYLF